MRTAVEHVNTEIADAVVGLDGSDQRLLDDELVALDGTDGKAPPRGQRHPRRLARRAPRPRPTTPSCPLYRYVGGANAHVLPVPFMNVLNGGAHADSNVDVQEFMLAPVGAASFAEGAALGRRDLPRAQGAAEGARACRPRWATKAASRRTCRRTRRRSRCCSPRSSVPATRPGDEIALALDIASTELFADGRYVLAGEGADYSSVGVGRPPRAALRPLPDRVDRGRHGGGRLGRLARAHAAPRRRACSSSATTSSSPTSSGSSGASSSASPTRSWSRSTRSARCRRPSTPCSSRAATATPR